MTSADPFYILVWSQIDVQADLRGQRWQVERRGAIPPKKINKETLVSECDLDLLPLVAKIVAAHSANNVLAPADLPALINEVYTAIRSLRQSTQGLTSGEKRPVVPIRKSVFKDYIVCLEDGRRMKTLKRHLGGAFGLTPQAYRERWGLLSDYPMVAPGYAEKRSQLAKAAGLGRFGRLSAPAHTKPNGPVIQKVPEGVSGKKLRRNAA